MKKLTPVRAFVILGALMALVLAADELRRGRFGHPGFERVGPDAEGLVRIDTSDLDRLEVRFYRFLNSGNQEVKFLVGRDEEGVVQVGFDASDSHYKLGRGFSYQDGWIIDNKCETTVRLSAINKGGRGCKPAAIAHRMEGDELIITEAQMLQGWRYFR